jgi:hypothetical protein
MSDTPRTDYYTKRLRNLCDDEFVPIEFARNLERDLTAVTKERDTALFDLEFRRDLFKLQEQQLNDVRAERDRLAEKLSEWKMLAGWGGTPEIINDFIKGQQSRIHAAQEAEEQRDEYRGLLIELYNDINVIHSGNAVAKLSHLMRDENYN